MNEQKACMAELHISVETRCRPDLDDIDAANILAVIEQLQAKIAELEEENARLKAASFFGKSKDIHALAEMVLSDCGCSSLHWPLMEKVENRLYAFFDEQLAAEQLNNKRLREDQELLVEAWNYGQFADDFDQPQAKPVRAAIRRFCEVLASPSGTSALDAYVAEKLKDSESRTGNQSPCYTIARDMAVRMWEKHYKTDAPNWEPLDDFMGVLSQISNMLTGLGNVEKITRQRDLAVGALGKLRGMAPADDALQAIKESEK